jgi:hypothetical protein
MHQRALLLALGDGVAEGAGVRYPLGFLTRLGAPQAEDATDLQGISLQSLCPKLRTYNRAVVGTSSLACLEKQILRLPPCDVFGIVVLTTGFDDLYRDYGRSPPREGAMFGARLEDAEAWLVAFDARLDRMVCEIRARFPAGCQIFLGTVLDPTDGTGDTECIGSPAWAHALRALHGLNRALARCAEEHADVHLVDLHGASLGHGIHASKFWHPTYRVEDPTCWYQPDLELPSERGADAIRRLFLLEIRRVLATR